MIMINGQIIIFIPEWTENTSENATRIDSFIQDMNQ